jgi:solute carrier family 25 carnitine/acylcarnitine transporter 20/29
MLMPLLGVGAQVSVQFGIVETLKKIFKNKFGDKEGNLHWKYSLLSGAIAGIPSAIVLVPLDHSRFRVTI